MTLSEQTIRDIAIGIARQRLENYPTMAAAAIDEARKRKERPLTTTEVEVLTAEIMREALDGFEEEGWAVLETMMNSTNEAPK